METIKISYNRKTKIVEEFEKQEFVQEVKKPSLLKKMGLGQKEYGTIHFQNGNIVSADMEYLVNAKTIIANTFTIKEKLIASKIDKEKIIVLYPSITMEYEKPTDVKKRVCEKLNIDENRKIVFFTARNFKTAGAKEFVELVASLNYKNLQIIISGDKKEIANFKFSASKFDFEDRLLILDDYENNDELFLAADVFILPTHSNAFPVNVLKAMFSKCAVFIPNNSLGKEVLDVFGLMNGPADSTIRFKIDALLGREDDLKAIQKQNRKIAKAFTLEENLEKLNNIVQTV